VITLAFVGCGRVARAHARRLRRHKRDVQIAFASRDPARAEKFGRELGGPAFASYDEALAAADVDVIAITTPPSSHLELALRALAAGKHVVLEKPAVASAADLDTLAAAAAQAGKRVFVAENYFYKPSLRRLRRLIGDGVIGEVLFVHVNAIKHQHTGGDWRDDRAVALGGALFEGGIHWIDFMANLGLDIRAVHGYRPGPPVSHGASIDRSMMVAFEYREGAVGMLSYSWEVPSTARGLRLSKIYGRRGAITFESNGLWIFCHGTRTRFYLPGLFDLAGYRAMWRDFVGAWKDDRDAEMTLAVARRDLALVEEAYATAIAAHAHRVATPAKESA
jgi:predicted dehydrogenase